MCGRFTLTTGDLGAVRSRFGLDERVEVRTRFNVVPGDDVLAVTMQGPAMLRWGFVPDLPVTKNARAETLLERAAWRGAMARGRCLIVADGFYEWGPGDRGRKQPYWVTRRDRAPFAFAGLASSAGTCTIVTTAATAGLEQIHPRMPVILEPEVEEAWLSPACEPAAAQELLRNIQAPVPTPVGPAVNDAGYDGPDCIEPAPAPLSLF